jgi:hypothetical protein
LPRLFRFASRRHEQGVPYLSKAGLSQQYVTRSLLRDAFGYKVPKQLSVNPDTDFLREYGSPTLPHRVRELADEIEQAESDTPDFGIDQLRSRAASTARQREQAARDLRRLPQVLRLYAEYFDESRAWWRVIGKLTREAKEKFERVVRDRLQMEIYWRTGKHSDLRYSHLVNLAREVVGKNPLDEKALLARRKRRLSSR